MIIKFQSSDDTKFYAVDLEKQTCACEAFKVKKFCSHLQRSIDIYKLSGKTERWNIMSQYHKEIRRGDLERGIMWARAFARISGSHQASGYCRNILFEETRNLDLYEKYKTNSASEKEQIHGMILSRKKWELDYMKDHFLYWNEGFLAYYFNKDKWSPEYMVERIQSYQTPAEAYEILFYVSENKEQDHGLLMVQGSTVEELFWVKMETKAIQENNEKLKRYLSFRPTSYYGRMVALELGIGYWHESANEYYPDKEIKDNYVPSSREYAYDCHGIIGQSRLNKNWKEIEENSFTKSSKIDLRWSGMLFGIYWRFECYRQHGLLTGPDGDIKWTDVKLDPIIWRETMLHDSFYYGKFYSKLRSSGYSVPLVKEDVATISMKEIYEKYGPKK